VSQNSGKTWLLASPGQKFKLAGAVISENELNSAINEVVLDTIRPYGSSEHRQDQYKKIEKYDHLLQTIDANVRRLTDSVKSDLSYGYLRPSDAEFLINDHFERLIDSISYAGSAIMASLSKNDEENY
jgi:hypothetical protein